MEAAANDRAYSTFLAIGNAVAVDRIGVNVTVAGQVGGIARLAIYGPARVADTLALLLDAGTVPVDSTGLKEITISQSLLPGWYALVCRFGGVGTTRPTMTVLRASTTGGGASGIAWNPAAAGANAYAGTSNPQVPGAFDATYTPGAGVAQAIPVVFVRFA